MESSEMIYTIGLTLIGLFVVAAAITIPVLLTMRIKLKKQLETEYGKISRDKRSLTEGTETKK